MVAKVLEAEKGEVIDSRGVETPMSRSMKTRFETYRFDIEKRFYFVTFEA